MVWNHAAGELRDGRERAGTGEDVRSQPRAGGRERGRPAGAEPTAVTSAFRRAPVGLFADRPRRADVLNSAH